MERQTEMATTIRKEVRVNGRVDYCTLGDIVSRFTAMLEKYGEDALFNAERDCIYYDKVPETLAEHIKLTETNEYDLTQEITYLQNLLSDVRIKRSKMVKKMNRYTLGVE